MARALECPACGARHRLDSLPSTETFRCDQCGQKLKVPATVSSDPRAPAPPARTGAPPTVGPPPRRRSAPPAGYAPAAAAGAGAATPEQVSTAASARAAAPARTGGAPALAATAATAAAATAAVDETSGAPTRAKSSRAPAPAAAPKRSSVAWYWRLVAWIVAVPLGFLLSAWPAYQLGFIKKDDLLDVFVGTGTGRYLRLAIVTVVWALVTALLVQLFVEGGRVRANRRRRTGGTTA